MVNARNELPFGRMAAPDAPPVEWRVSDRPVPYDQALAAMDARVDAVARHAAPELAWLIEHPPLYTAGTSADPADLIEARFPVHRTGRGGQFTYHGPGQRVVYLMLDLKRRTPDIRCYVATLEEWLIRTLWRFHVRGERREDRIGVWVRRFVTLHGISLNVDPDLGHFAGIVPCGITGPRYGVTSLADLGLPVTMPEVDMALRAEFEGLFGKTEGGGRMTDVR